MSYFVCLCITFILLIDFLILITVFMSVFVKKIDNPEFYVVGSGPGDPDLLTIRGFKVLESAKVILYDNLANKELLAIAPADCERVYVGKKPYGLCTSQETIHQLIKHYAFTRGNVVRLKGGDPFIFGRGFEEILFAREHGIESHYVPGISSMQASGLNDIPLTHRGVSESIWILTGTKKDGSLSSDLQLAIKSKATVVIYMGMKKLTEISTAYIMSGRGSVPAAIIQNASLPHQKQVICEVQDLSQAAMNSGLTHPAIIIIGDVVKAAEFVAAQEIHKYA